MLVPWMRVARRSRIRIVIVGVYEFLRALGSYYYFK